MNTFFRILIINGLAVLLLSSCSGKKKEAPIIEKESTTSIVTLTDEQLKHASISTEMIQQQNISSTQKLNGKIDVPPQNLVSISVPMGGYLKSTKLLPGMHIRKGEIIGIIEDQQYIQIQQDYLLTKSKLSLAETEYRRQKELQQGQASSEKTVQVAENEVRTNQIILKALSEKLKLIYINPESLNETNISKSIAIHSPINGYVSKVNVNIGKYVNPSDVLFELVNPEDIHLNIRAFEKDVTKLSIGQTVEAYTNVNPEKKYKCKIILISKNINSDGSTEVHCHFENYDKSLLPGMYMNADIELKSTAANVLSEESILLFEGKNFVFVENSGNSYEMTEVEIGHKENGKIEVLNAGKLANKKIVSKGAYTLLMKFKNTAEE